MKEFEGRVVKLGAGLRPDKVNTLQEPYLVECHNAAPYGEGLEPYEPLTALPTIPGVFCEWPFPQTFFTQSYKFYCTQTQVYTIDASWNYTLIAEVVGQYPWELMDFGTFVILTNGVELVYYDMETATWATKTSTEMHPMFQTCCVFKGQPIIGHLLSEWHGGDEGSIAWGNIGSFDFRLGKDNVAGLRKFPWPGVVLAVRALQDSIVVYCENGIGLLYPVGHTFGFKKLLDIGIAGRGAVTGDLLQHYFIDAAGYLWVLKNHPVPDRYDLEKVRLNYREWLTTLTPADIRMTWDATKQRCFISDSVGTYVYTGSGLHTTNQRPSSIVQLDGVAYGTFETGLDAEYRITTDSIDSQVRALKAVESIELGSHAAIDMQACIFYRYGYKESFRQSRWITANREGVAHVGVAANEWRASIRAVNPSDIYLDYLNYRIKLIDKRNIRGAYGVTQTTAGTSNA